ncbi:MAG: hypothetical protein FD126_1471 [Elusimicrobia bacterium]|nr:MAG: hypothetical protein FD126_1471 [Elusimicrobiota bacterium]
MDNQETKDEKVDEKGGCCSKAKCCGGKTLAALALLLVGGFGGYFAGRSCGKVCPVSQTAAPAAAPTQTPGK